LFLKGYQGIRSQNGPVRAVALGLFAASMLAGLFVATPALADTATLSMSPTHGQAATRITATGSGFGHGAAVTISFNGVGQAYVLTDSSGAFNVVFSAPSDPPGTYPVTASDGNNQATLSFTIDSSTTTTTTTTSTSTSSSSTSTTSSSSSSSTSSVSSFSAPKTTTVTTTVTSVSTSTVTSNPPPVTFTKTQTSTATATTTATTTSTTTALSTSVETVSAPPVTATTTVTQPKAAVTVTVSARQTSSTDPAAGHSSPQPVAGLSDTFLWVFAGVGILLLAISIGIFAMRGKATGVYKKGLQGGGS
jgi:hypothetical protein